MITSTTSSSRIFNIGSDSVFQYLNGSKKSNVLLSLPNLSFDSPNIIEVYLSVNHAEITNAFYLVNDTNNKLVINGSTYTIPPSNYNAISFLTEIQSGILTAQGIVGTYDIPSNKYTFTKATNFTFNIDTTCWKFLGFNPNNYTGTSLTSPFVCNFLPIPRINFHSSAFQTDNYNAKDNSNDIFLSVQNSSAPGAQILWNNFAQLKYDVTGVTNINLVDIRVTDDAGNFLDFNNIDWFLCLRIEVVYILNPIQHETFSSILSGKNKINFDSVTKKKEKIQTNEQQSFNFPIPNNFLTSS